MLPAYNPLTRCCTLLGNSTVIRCTSANEVSLDTGRVCVYSALCVLTLTLAITTITARNRPDLFITHIDYFHVIKLKHSIITNTEVFQI
jgi:hypothetical protein